MDSKIDNNSETSLTSLDTSSLAKSIESLGRVLGVVDRLKDTAEDDEMEALRSGAIQHFEFTYELCWKFMRRWIGLNVGSEIVDGVPRIELFRVSAENRLIDDVEKWMEFHRARNSTSHMYNEAVATGVFEKAAEFLPYAKTFFERLEARL